MTIGEKIRQLRKSKGLSGKTFSFSVGKSSGWITQVEQGKITPSASTVMLIERTYGVSLAGEAAPAPPAVEVAGEQLSKKEKKLVHLYRRLQKKDDIAAEALLGYMQSLVGGDRAVKKKRSG